MWKRLKSRTILTHPRLTVVEDDIELPGGQTTTYLRYENVPHVVSIICERGDGKILIQREYVYPINQKIFQFPGGVVNDNEEVPEGANRELMEEAGLRALSLNLIGRMLLNNRRCDALIYIFHVKEYEEDKRNGDIEEDIESFWFTVDEIDEMIRKGKVLDPTALAAWSFYKLKRVNDKTEKNT